MTAERQVTRPSPSSPKTGGLSEHAEHRRRLGDGSVYFPDGGAPLLLYCEETAATAEQVMSCSGTDGRAAAPYGGFAGHTDWRQPNLTELESMRNHPKPAEQESGGLGGVQRRLHLRLHGDDVQLHCFRQPLVVDYLGGLRG